MPYTRAQLIELVQRTAAQYGIDPNVAVAQIQAESNFNPNAVSPAGAQGLFQFVPGTWAQWGSGSPFNPEDAAPAWGKLMAHLLGIFGGRYDIALAAYNSGESRAEYRNAAAEGRPINWEVFNTPALRRVYTETQAYVNRILGTSSYVPQTGADAAPNETLSDVPAGSGYFLPITISALLLFFILTGDD